MFHHFLGVYSLLFFYFFSGQDIFYMEHLIEEDGKVYRRFTGESISGIIYESFNDPRVNVKLVGRVTNSFKDGHWTQWWDNGHKKTSGIYSKGVKNGFWYEWNHDGIMHFETYYKMGQVIQVKNCLSDICDSSLVQKDIQIKF